MRRMGYYFAVVSILVMSIGMARFASAQTYATDNNSKLMITESSAQPRFAASKRATNGESWTPSVSELVPSGSDPTEPAKYSYYYSPDSKIPITSTAVNPDRSEGDYFGQVVVLNWTPPGLTSFPPNLVTAPQARAVVWDNNGVSVKDYIADVSSMTDSPWETHRLNIKYRVNQSGQPLDVFSFNVQHPWDNCNERLFNEIPGLINNMLPAGNKINEQHFTYIVVNMAVYQTGGCSNLGTATVSPVRSMQTGNIIWIPEDAFVANQYYAIHELIHTLGVGHSRMAWSNGSPDPRTWPAFEYGDPACVMAGALRRLNSYQAAKLGWYKGNTRLKELRFAMTYNAMPPTEQTGIASKSLKYSQVSYVVASSGGVPNGIAIFPEIREKANYDSFLSVTNYRFYKESVALRWGDANLTAAATSSVLINTAGTPDSSAAPLVLSQPFTIWNLRFTLVSPFSMSTGARFALAFVN